MSLFEVFIPGKESGMPNVTLTVEAQNWIGALRSGLKSIGEGQEAIANVMCDIKDDNSIHVTDVATRRVFRLRELNKVDDPQTLPEPRPISLPPDSDETLKNVRPDSPAHAAAAQFAEQPKTLIEFPMVRPPVALPNPEASVAWTKMPAPAPAPVAPAPPSASALAKAAKAPAPVTTPERTAPVAAPSAPAAPAPSASAAATVAVTKPVGKPVSGSPTPRGVPAPKPQRPSGQFSSAAAPVTREVTAPQPTDPRIGRVTPPPEKSGAAPVDVQDAIAAVFDATQDLYMQPTLSAQHVADKLLDIALAHIPADAGSFYIADVNGHELVFAAVRGPKADALRKSGVTLKVGQGIIGFCAQEGVCLVVNDIQKDPRFFAAIAKSIDYQPKDTLCASAEKEGRLWGAVQLINSRGGFEAAHMEVLRFIGLTAAAMLERIDDRRGG